MEIKEMGKRAVTEAALSLVRGVVRYAPDGEYKEALWSWANDYLLWRANIAKRTVSTLFGQKVGVQLPDAVQTSIYFTGAWEPTITAYFQSCLEPGDTFVDVGANVGYYSLLASKCVGRNGRVYAIEASHSVFEELKANIARNRAANVTAINALVAAANGEQPFWLGNPKNIGGSTSVRELAERSGFRYEGTVRAAPLPELVPIEVLRVARIIKIDVEGAEFPVLAPLLDSLGEFEKTTEWMIEFTPSYCVGGQADVDVIFGAFSRAGYRPYSVPNPYTVSHYLQKPFFPELTLLTQPPQQQADILFTRQR